jgi:hypothetical protein
MNEESSTALKSAVLGFVNWDLAGRRRASGGLRPFLKKRS